MRPYFSGQTTDLNLRHFAARNLASAGGVLLAEANIQKLIWVDPEGVAADIRAALDKGLVVVVPSNSLLNLDDLARLCATLGEVVPAPYLESIKGFDGFARVVRETDETGIAPFASGWHSDWSFLERPPEYSMLYAVDVPQLGGGTLFSNQVLACEHLSDGLLTTLEQQVGMHSARKSYGPSGVYARDRGERTMRIRICESADAFSKHRVLRRHHATGRRCLFVNEAYTTGLVDWEEYESEGLLKFLFRWSVLSEFVFEVQWESKMLVVWDNRYVNHRAVADYDGQRRELIRATLQATDAGIGSLSAPVVSGMV